MTPETLSASYARISRDPRSVDKLRAVARTEVAKARRSNRNIIFKMGHHSIAEHAVFNFDILGVSRLALEEIEWIGPLATDDRPLLRLHLGSAHARLGMARQAAGDARAAFQDYLEAQREMTAARRGARDEVEAVDRFGDLVDRQLAVVRTGNSHASKRNQRLTGHGSKPCW